MSLLNSPLFVIKPEEIEQIFSIASVCDDVRVPEEQNVFHMSSWKGMWTFSTCYMNYGEKASALIKAFTRWVMKLWMAQTWYICTWDWCNSGQSRIWSHVAKGSCKIQNSGLFSWPNAPLPTPYIQLRTHWEDVYRCWVCFQEDVVVAMDGF